MGWHASGRTVPTGGSPRAALKARSMSRTALSALARMCPMYAITWLVRMGGGMG